MTTTVAQSIERSHGPSIQIRNHALYPMLTIRHVLVPGRRDHAFKYSPDWHFMRLIASSCNRGHQRLRCWK
jgi:hypothetical protein